MMIGRGIAVSVVVAVATLGTMGCSSTTKIACTMQTECDAYHAVCSDGFCVSPNNVKGDLAGIFSQDAGDAAMMSEQDSSAGPDLSLPPDLSLFCGSGAAMSCPTNQPICGANMECRACADTDQAACTALKITAPRCDDTTGACAACRPANQAQDCPLSAASVCSFDGSCRQACTTNADCTDSGICDMGVVNPGHAVCARASEVLYVKAQSTCPTSADGTQGNPLCNIDAAIAKLPSGGFITVQQNTALALPRVTTPITNGYVITGPATAFNKPGAPISSPGASAFTVTGGRLLLSGFNFTSGATSVTCSGAGSLNISQISTRGLTGVGLEAGTCDLTIDRAWFANGASHGIHQTSGKFTATNVIASDNTGMGIRLEYQVSMVLVAFLTVVNNADIAMLCPVGGLTIQDSIIWGNMMSGGTSWQNCSFLNGDVNPGIVGNYNTEPDWVYVPIGVHQNQNTYRLMANTTDNMTCCIDRAHVLPSPAAPVTHDIDGDSRPMGAGSDIGADEVQ